MRPQSLPRAALGHVLVLAAVSAAVTIVAFDSGGYAVSSRTAVGAAVWWIVTGAVAVRLWRVRSLEGVRAACVWSLACLAVFSLLSAAWTSNAGRAFLEFDRVAMFLGVFLLAAFIAAACGVDAVADGLALAIAVTCLVAIGKRFLYPNVLASSQLPSALPSTAARLAYPLAYWNGLGVFAALGVPLLLRRTLFGHRVVRASAAAFLPMLGGVIYLTSSRSAAAVAIVAAVVFLAATSDRSIAVAVAAVAGAGAAAFVGMLVSQPSLVDDPASRAAFDEGPRAAVLGGLICVAVGAVVWFLVPRVPRVGALSPRARLAAAAVAVVALAVLLAAAHPIERFHAFQRPPTTIGSLGRGGINEHFVSATGTGRWQTWSAAVHEFTAHPFGGGGAGSFPEWWAQHGSLSGHVENAHSLYLEVLGELGLVGLIAVLTFVGAVVAAGSRAVGGARGRTRVTAAAALAAFVAWAVAAGVDWMWQVTVVSGVGVALAAVLVVGAENSDAAYRPVTERLLGGRKLIAIERAPDARPRRASVAPVLVVLGTVLVAAEGIALLADQRMQRSQAAAARGDTAAAVHDALSAKSLEPWSSAPYLQLALLAESSGDLPAATRWIAGAIDRDHADWSLWLVRSRLETKRGKGGKALRSLCRAIHLNPRSPLFSAGVFPSIGKRC